MKKTKAVLVTGGAKRVGKAICMEYAKAGYYVMIHCNRSVDEADKLAHQINMDYVGASVIDFDLSKGGANFLIEKTLLLCRRLDLELSTLVNNASLFEYDTADTYFAQSHTKHMQVNYQAPVEMSMAFFHHLVKHDRQGDVIQILDQKLDNLNVDYFSYTLSKEALRSSLKMMAMSCAPHLRVNAVLPGLMLISGEMTRSEFSKAMRVAALGQSNSPEELAQTCLFLTKSDKVTGQQICVDGGCHLIPSRRDVAFQFESKEVGHVLQK